MSTFECYRQLFEVRARYEEEARKINCFDPCVVRDLLKTVVEEYTGYTIRILAVNWPSEKIRSRLERNDEEKVATITFSAELNHCWRSFSIAKEMAHLIFDLCCRGETQTPENMLEIIQTMLSDSMFGGNLHGIIQQAVLSERTMILGAAELLFPIHHARDYGERLANGQLTPFAVARIFRIPTIYVERLTHSEFLEIWGAFVDTVNDK